MDDHGRYSPSDILRLFGKPTVSSDLPGGGVMVMKGGVVGLGWSPYEATADWWQNLTDMLVPPSAPGTPSGDTKLHIPLDDPTEEAHVLLGSEMNVGGK